MNILLKHYDIWYSVKKIWGKISVFGQIGQIWKSGKNFGISKKNFESFHLS